MLAHYRQGGHGYIRRSFPPGLLPRRSARALSRGPAGWIRSRVIKRRLGSTAMEITSIGTGTWATGTPVGGQMTR
jgi:hypothetical protein